MKVRLRNTADHWLAPGDEGQELELADVPYRVIDVRDTESPFLLTYGLRLIPSEVDVELERADEPVIVQ